MLLGKANGSFDAPMDFVAGWGDYGLALGDLNDDGSLDVACANAGGAEVTVLFSSTAVSSVDRNGRADASALYPPFLLAPGGPVVLAYRLGSVTGPVRLAAHDVRGRAIWRSVPLPSEPGEHSL